MSTSCKKNKKNIKAFFIRHCMFHTWYFVDVKLLKCAATPAGLQALRLVVLKSMRRRMDSGRRPGRDTHLGLLPELRLLLSGTWSLFSAGVSEAEADDDWDDTDSLLPIDVSSVARLGAWPAADTDAGDSLVHYSLRRFGAKEKKKKKHKTKRRGLLGGLPTIIYQHTGKFMNQLVVKTGKTQRQTLFCG